MFCILTIAGVSAFAQGGTGTISGTVLDTQSAVVPSAQVTLENTTSGDKRVITSNGSGFFHFASVPVGTYKVTVDAAGFEPYIATDIIIHAGDDRTLPQLVMQVSGSKSTVQVVASEAGVIPLDNGTSSTTINQELVENVSIQGRDAAELVKFMPGMGMNNGLSQTPWNSQTTSTNSGPIGQFSANGTQPYGGMQMTLDGASLTDVGNQGTQIANVNQDTTAEFTYLNAAFGADTPRGPTIIQIASKAGGQQFHGNAYTYLRNWQANSNDAYYKAANPGASRPMDHQVYPGGTIGGPVILPWTDFNRNRDKLFFFAGFEKMFQNPFPNIHFLDVPSAGMLAGDFNPNSTTYTGKDSGVPGAQSSSSTWWQTSQTPCLAGASPAPNYTSYCGAGNTTNPGFSDWNNGVLVNKGAIDPDGLALLTYLNKLHPPNIDPATHNGYNYQYLDAPPVNRWELRLRGDYDPTQNDKFNVVYTQQNEADINNFGIWWSPGSAAPVPSSLNATTLSKMWTANYTRILNATTTNEAAFSYTYFTFPPAFTNPTAMMASTAGYTTYAPYGQVADNAFDQLPNIISWGNGASNGSYNGGFSSIYAPPAIKAFNNGYGNIKKAWAWQDNFSKVWGTHTLKAGFFWSDNNQTQTTGYGTWTQGMIEFDDWSSYTTGNQFADMLLGHTDGITQAGAAPVHDMTYNEWAIYAQDSWHATHKLTLNYGVRFDHEGQWYPVKGNGLAVWDAAAYALDSNNDSGVPSVVWPGMRWHQNKSSVPISGFISRTLIPDPRVGFAYDIHGDGKTVVRGGVGIYHWQLSEGDIDPALSPSWNVPSVVTGSTSSYAALAAPPSPGGTWCALPQGADASKPNSAYGGNTCPSGIDAIKEGEDKTPYTMNWVAMVDQELPGHMVFELQYIGNHTDNALLTGNGTTENFYSNINKIPVGGLYGTYHLTGAPNDGQNLWDMSCATGRCGVSSSDYYSGYRPYKNYGVLNVIQHGSYSNYNGMVLALQKQTGRYTLLANYTWSKVMGIRDGQSDNGSGDGTMIDPFNLRANYGPLAYDHTHIFNTAYVLHLPGTHSTALMNALTNGWDLSGDVQVQSGAPIQPNTSGTLNVSWGYSASSAKGNNLQPSNTYLLGTNAVVLVPYLSCDPRGTQGKGYFNPNCFETPTTMGQNGPAVWPYIHGPAYSNADLAVARNFKITERQNILFRASAFNFLNHPLPTFGLGSDLNLSMSCNSSTQDSLTPTCDGGGRNTNNGTHGTTGSPAYETGRRVVEVALKYSF
ncbi:MAG TPA: carboxypeptidase regulatory-like domain-containing protein [Alloacidobacterium sp.]|nr:carboxypeptidase regulatory-like domain-containing protein [Alloacidobacterium sp.]